MLTRRKCCCVTNCPIAFDVNGCRSEKLAGATCSVWTDSSKSTFVGSATTNSSGLATVMAPGPGTYYREISRARFVTNSGDVAVFACPAGTSVGLVTLPPAPGYHCIPQRTACAVPAADVLYAATSLGPATLTYNPAAPGGGGWTGSITRTYIGGCGAACDHPAYPGGGGWAAPYDFSVFLVFRGGLTMQYAAYRCPDITQYGVPGGCPVPDGNTSPSMAATATMSVVLDSCPPSLSVGGNYSWGTQASSCFGASFQACAIPVDVRAGIWGITE